MTFRAQAGEAPLAQCLIHAHGHRIGQVEGAGGIVVDHGQTYAAVRIVVQQAFRQAGLFTASISTFPERHSSWWFSAGFHETYNVGGRGGESGEEVLPVALDWLDRHGDAGNWYLHVHLWDPHTPYRAPESFGNPFADEPLCTFVDETVLQTHLKR